MTDLRQQTTQDFSATYGTFTTFSNPPKMENQRTGDKANITKESKMTPTEQKPQGDGLPDVEARGDLSKLFAKLKLRKSFYHKLVCTAAIIMAEYAVCVNEAILGPILLDLQQLTHTTTSGISLLFLVRGLLALVSSIAMGPVLDKINLYWMVGVSLLFSATLNFVAPVSTNLTSLLLILGPPSFAECLVVMGLNLICLELWKDNSGPLLQAINFAGLLAYMTGPLLAQPFLSDTGDGVDDDAGDGVDDDAGDGVDDDTGDGVDDDAGVSQQVDTVTASPDINSSVFLTGDSNTTTVADTLDFSNTPLPLNTNISCNSSLCAQGATMATDADIVTMVTEGTVDTSLDTTVSVTTGWEQWSVSVLNNSTDINTLDDSTDVKYVLWAVALYSLAVGIFLVAIFVLSKYSFRQPAKTEDEEDNHSGNSKRFVITVGILVCIFNFFYAGTETAYTSFVMTFAVEYLDWTKDDGTWLLTLLQASNAIVILSCIPLSKYIRPNVLLGWDLTVLIVALVVEVLFVQTHDAVLWGCSIGVGIGSSIIIPSTLAWLDAVVGVNGKLMSAYWASYFASYMVVPTLTGFLFKEFHPMYFVYINLVCAVSAMLFFILLSFTIAANSPKKESTDL